MITYITYSYIILSLKLSVVYVCYVCVYMIHWAEIINIVTALITVNIVSRKNM